MNQQDENVLIGALGVARREAKDGESLPDALDRLVSGTVYKMVDCNRGSAAKILRCGESGLYKRLVKWGLMRRALWVVGRVV